MYTFKAVQWGTDVTETYKTRREMYNRVVGYWLNWDVRDDGYLPCSPVSLTGPCGTADSAALYAVSHDVWALRAVLKKVG